MEPIISTPSRRPRAASIGALGTADREGGGISNLWAALGGDAMAAAADVAAPSVLRAISEPCKIVPRAPRMSSSVPCPLFLESLPQLSLPPPSVEEGDDELDEADRGTASLSSSLRERSTALAAGAFSTSCPSALSWRWPRQQGSEPEGAEESGSSNSNSNSNGNGNSSLGTSPATMMGLGLGPGPQSLAALRGSSLTALALLLRRHGATGAGDATAGSRAASPAVGPASASACASPIPGSHGVGEAAGGKAASAPSAAVPLHVPEQHAAGKAPNSAAQYGCSASTMPTTATTTTTTVASVSSKEDEEEQELGSTASSLGEDVAVGPFDLDELSI